MKSFFEQPNENNNATMKMLKSAETSEKLFGVTLEDNFMYIECLKKDVVDYREINCKLAEHKVDEIIIHLIQLFSTKFLKPGARISKKAGPNFWHYLRRESRIRLAVLNNREDFADYIKTEQDKKILTDMLTNIITRCHQYWSNHNHQSASAREALLNAFQQVTSWEILEAAMICPIKQVKETAGHTSTSAQTVVASTQKSLPPRLLPLPSQQEIYSRPNYIDLTQTNTNSDCYRCIESEQKIDISELNTLIGYLPLNNPETLVDDNQQITINSEEKLISELTLLAGCSSILSGLEEKPTNLGEEQTASNNKKESSSSKKRSAQTVQHDNAPQQQNQNNDQDDTRSSKCVKKR